MKRKTYNNVLKAGKLIQAKGYSEKESLEIAVQKFDELASLKNGMSVEWLIDRMATKTEREGESMKLSESDKNYFKKCGYLDQDIPQIEKAIEVMQYEDENDKKVSRKYVLDNMDRETWLSGIGRAAFHWSATRETKDGKTIFFDARSLKIQPQKRVLKNPLNGAKIKLKRWRNHTKIKDCGEFQIVSETFGMCYLLAMLMSTVFHIKMNFRLIS